MVLTQSLREALMRMKKDPQLQPFVDALRTEFQHECQAMIGLEAPMVYRAQGRASYVSDLLKLIEQVDSVGVLTKPTPGGPMTAGLF